MFCHGVSVRGSSHEKSNSACQDAYAIAEPSEGLSIAAVADGLGSAQYSDVAAQIAVNESVRYCKKHIARTYTSEDILQTIETSFSNALNAIEKEAETQGRVLSQYHTTLSLALLFEDTLYYGHSGDSGIIALTTTGLYENVTVQQQNAKGEVFPLFRKHRWVFKQFNKKVCSVLLATDGMLSALAPFLLKNEPVNIWVSLAGFFMDTQSFRVRIDEQGEDAVKVGIDDCVKRIPPQRVNYDDKTIVVLVNTTIVPDIQPDDYYKEPDWEGLACKRAEEWEQQWEHLDDTVERSANTILPVESEYRHENDFASSDSEVKEATMQLPKKKAICKWLFGR